jgi:hypothetical protein
MDRSTKKSTSPRFAWVGLFMATRDEPNYGLSFPLVLWRVLSKVSKQGGVLKGVARPMIFRRHSHSIELRNPANPLTMDNNMNIPDDKLEVLQNLEFSVVTVWREHPEMLDYAALRAHEAAHQT